MDSIMVCGGRPLYGETKIQGSKNAALPILAATVLIKGVTRLYQCPRILDIIYMLHILREIGCTAYWDDEDVLVVDAEHANQAIPYLETQEYPGFPTDLQSQLMAVLTIADGTSRIQETIFEERYKVVGELQKMGARITIRDREAVIEGVPRLQGSSLKTSELRGGAALIIAGLMAQQTTVVENAHFIKRGYEDIVQDLQELSAAIKYI